MAARLGRRRRQLDAWLEQHARALIGALGRLREQRAANLMTAAVIGIALALPAAFLLLLDNLELVTGDWEGRTRASLFLERNLDAEGQTDAAQQVRAVDGVARVELIPPEEALAEFRTHSGMGDALALLEENPLPPVLVVEPAAELDPAAVEAVMEELAALAPVVDVRLDREWLRRLHALMRLAERGVWVITSLLGLTVILVVGNTIRLDIENRREEIVITKLIGGTDAFVRRPFLYAGLWYGLGGGLLACILVEGGRWLLAGPAGELASLYGTGFRLRGLGLDGALTLLACGAALGLLGSWLAVGRHLSAIEPR
ncbi:permease-like cell division protein FtsX [Sediminicurvatus halobius]|uniref:Cell division protein FtsX n=1 Tax=Sediminicurvatus halobius TaxID=2182432 RepID=A0A2U2N1K2_9GAMM|nr:permease-like cell division protein FtsX [Spiribacter halobius]PWG63105.1 cell division protein FtsX [Spiribacter halobius]UEX77555.1 permease-like cell division protein FtsX [Spiribacter halobius]